jgi:hypothetical protein
MRRYYVIITKIRENSGLGWDSELQLPTCSDDVWETYIAAHPEAKNWRKTRFPLYDKISELVIGGLATGNFAVSVDDIFLLSTQDEDGTGVESEEVLPDRETPTSDSSQRDSRSQSPPSVPRKQKKKQSDVSQMADAMFQVAAAISRRQDAEDTGAQIKTKQEEAIARLQEMWPDYGDKVELVRRINVLMDPTCATVFLTIEDDEVREIWLQSQMNK